MTLEVGADTRGMTHESDAELAGGTTLEEDTTAPGCALHELALGATVPSPDEWLRLSPDGPDRHGAPPFATNLGPVIGGLLHATDGTTLGAEDEDEAEAVIASVGERGGAVGCAVPTLGATGLIPDNLNASSSARSIGGGA